MTQTTSTGRAAADASPAAATLLSPWEVREVRLRNRIGVSPMCQHSADDGHANDWHLVHLGSRAVGGAGLVMVEMTAVEPAGRISPGDMGIWAESHVPPLRRVAAFVEAQGAVPGIQIGHAGRKGSRRRPWEGQEGLDPASDGWQIVGPSPIPLADGWAAPRPLERNDLDRLVERFGQATRRARDAGFRWLELHAAHGYLLHTFLSPLSNTRDDEFGGPFANRIRFPLAVVEAMRSVWPDDLPLAVRVSATDWVAGGWTVEETVEFARHLKERGVDVVDCSSGGADLNADVPRAPGYQVPFARRVRQEAGVPTAAVGLITEPEQADAIVRDGSADLVMLARQMLREPYFALRATGVLGADARDLAPARYLRAF